MEKAGTATTARASTASSSETTRKRVTVPTQRARNPRLRACVGSLIGPADSAVRSRRGSARTPSQPSAAGTRVIAMSTATTMVAAAAMPIWVRNGMPTTNRPASAMTTVRPAVTTAEPAVPTAVATAVPTSAPCRSSWRKRVTMNSV